MFSFYPFTILFSLLVLQNQVSASWFSRNETRKNMTQSIADYKSNVVELTRFASTQVEYDSHNGSTYQATLLETPIWSDSILNIYINIQNSYIEIVNFYKGGYNESALTSSICRDDLTKKNLTQDDMNAFFVVNTGDSSDGSTISCLTYPIYLAKFETEFNEVRTFNHLKCQKVGQVFLSSGLFKSKKDVIYPDVAEAESTVLIMAGCIQGIQNFTTMDSILVNSTSLPHVKSVLDSDPITNDLLNILTNNNQTAMSSNQISGKRLRKRAEDMTVARVAEGGLISKLIIKTFLGILGAGIIVAAGFLVPFAVVAYMYWFIASVFALKTIITMISISIDIHNYSKVQIPYHEPFSKLPLPTCQASYGEIHDRSSERVISTYCPNEGILLDIISPENQKEALKSQCWYLDVNCTGMTVQKATQVNTNAPILNTMVSHGEMTLRKCSDSCSQSSECTAFEFILPAANKNSRRPTWAYTNCTLYGGPNIQLNPVSTNQFPYYISGTKA